MSVVEDIYDIVFTYNPQETSWVSIVFVVGSLIFWILFAAFVDVIINKHQSCNIEGKGVPFIGILMVWFVTTTAIALFIPHFQACALGVLAPHTHEYNQGYEAAISGDKEIYEEGFALSGLSTKDALDPRVSQYAIPCKIEGSIWLYLCGYAKAERELNTTDFKNSQIGILQKIEG